ncbi:hypothetical protein PTKIN_Ptkin07bG0069300 [Pterospermum kingtungense]
MAMNVSSSCFSVFSYKKVNRRRCVASEDFAASLRREAEDKVKLGGSELKVTRLGIGAWSWGDTIYWNNFEWDDRKVKAAKAAFDASVDRGITFFDTAEIYGSQLSLGAINSETLLGRFIGERNKMNPGLEVVVATKFAALPWRFGRQSVLKTLKDSICRLGFSSVDLYKLHWPGVWENEGYIDGLGDAVEQGLVKAVGVSNYNGNISTDNYYWQKKPEENGVKAACDELGITLIAYCPLAQGTLTGKYTPDNPPTWPRAWIYTPEFLTKLQPLLSRIRGIGENYGKTPTQVVLNWLIAQENVVPIPGAKNAEQAEEFVGALGWRLSNEEVDALRLLASEINPVLGLPFENL